MQNVGQSDNQNHDTVNVQLDVVKSSTQSSASSPAKSETETYSELQPRFMTDSSESEEDSVSEGELEEEGSGSEGSSGAAGSLPGVAAAKFLLPAHDQTEHSVDPETQARLEALLEAAGIGKLSTGDGKHLADPEVLRRLTSSVSCALDEAAAALTRMRCDPPTPATVAPSSPATPMTTAATTVPTVPQHTRHHTHQGDNTMSGSSGGGNIEGGLSLAEACSDGDVGTVRKLLTEGRSVHETTEEGESLLSLACSAGYYELAQVLLAMQASVEDRGIKGDCTPLMEAASAGHADIVRLLVAHGADVNAQSATGNTPLMYACAGGHAAAAAALLDAGANVEDHNENGHTPLMEAASAGHVAVARVLLERGAGINTHSNEFKESALTLACYKGHLDMVRFLLAAGADREHKTDEMHTALMEASMDGHVEVARLLLDSGAQVNMPTDSFESPLTLAACGGHVELAMLLLERGANIEEVNDEGYTPLMEAAREGHEEMVALLLGHGAAINAQTEETQETALTLACCGGFLEVADFLIKADADLELGASTPLMEAAQEGHMELLRYLLESGADVHAQTSTGDTALSYACENGHTDAAELLLRWGAELEHESEGGRTPLMKACRAGHLCTAQFLVSKGADVNRASHSGDHTPLSLACTGGHLDTVKFLLAHNADPLRKLKDNSTMLIEAAKGGHTAVVQLLLDYPHSVMMQQRAVSTEDANVAAVSPPAVAPGGTGLTAAQAAQLGLTHAPTPGMPHAPLALVPHPTPHHHHLPHPLPPHQQPHPSHPPLQPLQSHQQHPHPTHPPLQPLQTHQQHPPHQQEFAQCYIAGAQGYIDAEQQAAAMGAGMGQAAGQTVTSIAPAPAPSPSPAIKAKGTARKAARPADHHLPPPPDIMQQARNLCEDDASMRHDQIFHKQQILEELQRVERELAAKSGIQLPDHRQQQSLQQQQLEQQQHHLQQQIQQQQLQQPLQQLQQPLQQPLQQLQQPLPQQLQQPLPQQLQQPLPQPLQQPLQQPLPQPLQQQQGGVNLFPLQQRQQLAAQLQQQQLQQQQLQQQQLQLQLHQHQQMQLQHQHQQQQQQQVQPHPTAASAVSQNTAIQDRPKAKPVSKKEGKNGRKAAMQALDQLKVIQQNQQQTVSLQQANSQLHQQQQAVNAQLQQQQQALLLQQQHAMLQQHLQHLQQPRDLDDELMEACDSEEKAMETKLLNVAIALTSGSTGTTANLPGSGAAGAGNGAALGNARDLAGMLEYLQREVPSLVHLPPLELRSLVLQVMQKKLMRHKYVDETGTEVLGDPGSAFDSLALVLDVIAPAFSPDEHLVTPEEYERQLEEFILEDRAGIFVPKSVEQLDKCTGVDSVKGIMPSNNLGLEQQWMPPQPAMRPQLRPAECEPAGLISTVPAAAPVLPTAASVVQRRPNLTAATQTTAPPPPRHHPMPPLKKKGRFAAQRGNAAGAAPANVAPVAAPAPPPAPVSCIDVDGETESNRDTALTLACAGGHEELVELLLSRGADIEHRDKKGFTPLILAATAGHEKVAEILLNRGADLEAQSERTKDTPLSLACSGGRYEVVELALARGANKEHRNVSDYTPLSLAASGGYVNIIRLLLSHQAEINSRTGSKLGISPLMLAAMNGHTAAVRLLLDMGSDINAQIETNRNTALTLACFQGRHEVVSLLLDRKANVEHRAKTGLTPLMEAASGGYTEVGRVLLDKGADVNAPPVPSSRDTALTIAADKGHTRFVELLLQRGAAVEVKNKKGNSPLWLAANGGHANVVEMLYAADADIDSQDNRKVSCLMAAFRKGHVKVVKWMVGVVTQFPSDQEMTRYVCTLSDKELLERCHECVRLIRAAKETQAARANKNATILLEELDAERVRQESRRAAAQRRKERKKKKRMEKKEERRKLLEENEKNSAYSGEKLVVDDDEDSDDVTACVGGSSLPRKEEGDSGIDANSQGSCSSSDVKSTVPEKNTKVKKKKKGQEAPLSDPPDKKSCVTTDLKQKPTKLELKVASKSSSKQEKENVAPLESAMTIVPAAVLSTLKTPSKEKGGREAVSLSSTPIKIEKRDRKSDDDGVKVSKNARKSLTMDAHDGDTHYSQHSTVVTPNSKGKKTYLHESDSPGKTTSPKQPGTGTGAGTRRDEGWKEVVRKSSAQALSIEVAAALPTSGARKVSVPAHAISRVIGRAGSNINAIRAATAAHIDVDKQARGQAERIITIKGSAEATRQAHALIAAVIRDPDADVAQMLAKSRAVSSTATGVTSTITAPTAARALTLTMPTTLLTSASRSAAPRLATHLEKRSTPLSQQLSKTVTYSGRPMTAPPGPPPAPTPTSAGQNGANCGAPTFAAKLTSGDTIAAQHQQAKQRMQQWPISNVSTSSMDIPSRSQSGHTTTASQQPVRPTPQRSNTPPWSPARCSPLGAGAQAGAVPLQPSTIPSAAQVQQPIHQTPANALSALHINTHPTTHHHHQQSNSSGTSSSSGGALEYSLFNHGGVWGRDHSVQIESHPVTHESSSIAGMNSVQVDVSKAPGYRGTTMSLSGAMGGSVGSGASGASASPGSGAGSPPMPVPPAPPAPPQPPQMPMHSHHNYHQYADVPQGMKSQPSVSVQLSRSTPVSSSGNSMVAPVPTSSAPPQSSSNSAPLPPPQAIGNGLDMSMLTRNGPTYNDIHTPRSTHNMMMGTDYDMLTSSLSGGSVSVGNSGGMSAVGGRLNPRAPDYLSAPPVSQPTQTQPTQHHQYVHHNHQVPQGNMLFAGSNVGSVGGMNTVGSTAGISALLLSYQQQQQKQQHHQHYQQQQSLLERNGGVRMGRWTGVEDGSCESEERKPRPIGTERAWKLGTSAEWELAAQHPPSVPPAAAPPPPHALHMHHAALQQSHHIPHRAYDDLHLDRYQPSLMETYVGAGGGGTAGATAAALSLMHAMPHAMQYLEGGAPPPAHHPPHHQPPPPTHQHHHHWDVPPHLANDKQGWTSKWTH